MPILFVLAVLLLIFAIYGGVAISPLLWFVVILAVFFALFGYWGNPRSRL